MILHSSAVESSAILCAQQQVEPEQKALAETACTIEKESQGWLEADLQLVIQAEMTRVLDDATAAGRAAKEQQTADTVPESLHAVSAASASINLRLLDVEAEEDEDAETEENEDEAGEVGAEESSGILLAQQQVELEQEANALAECTRTIANESQSRLEAEAQLVVLQAGMTALQQALYALDANCGAVHSVCVADAETALQQMAAVNDSLQQQLVEDKRWEGRDLVAGRLLMAAISKVSIRRGSMTAEEAGRTVDCEVDGEIFATLACAFRDGTNNLCYRTLGIGGEDGDTDFLELDKERSSESCQARRRSGAAELRSSE
ncbi:hypothetical protein B484DRAFT_404971, partial [Ochromonadaceae sp. CCMP2298]